MVQCSFTQLLLLLFGLDKFPFIGVALFLCLQGEVLEESVMMVPDTKRRLAAAWDELSKLMVHVVFTVSLFMLS